LEPSILGDAALERCDEHGRGSFQGTTSEAAEKLRFGVAQRFQRCDKELYFEKGLCP
jgi:hypothetical protein